MWLRIPHELVSDPAIRGLTDPQFGRLLRRLAEQHRAGQTPTLEDARQIARAIVAADRTGPGGPT